MQGSTLTIQLQFDDSTAADVKLAKCAHFQVKNSICCFALFFNSMTTSGFRHITSSFKNQRFHWFCVKQETHFWRALHFSTARLPVTNKRVHSRISIKNIAYSSKQLICVYRITSMILPLNARVFDFYRAPFTLIISIEKIATSNIHFETQTKSRNPTLVPSRYIYLHKTH